MEMSQMTLSGYQVLCNEGQFIEAEKVYDTILRVHPRSGKIHNDLAIVKLSQEKIYEARQLLQDTIRDDPKYAFTYHSLATIYIKDGDLQRAIELMNEAIKYAGNKQELIDFIATRESLLAQSIVSVTYDVPASDIVSKILQAANS